MLMNIVSSIDGLRLALSKCLSRSSPTCNHVDVSPEESGLAKVRLSSIMSLEMIDRQVRSKIHT